MKKVQYDNEDMVEDLTVLRNELKKEEFTPHLIIGLSRGGLIPAVYMSHHYQCKLEPLVWSTRDHAERNTSRLSKIVEAYMGMNVLVVDDICDSGQTLHEVDSYVKACISSHQRLAKDKRNINLRYVALVNNVDEASNKFKVNHYGSEINRAKNHDWIIFPWECNGRVQSKIYQD